MIISDRDIVPHIKEDAWFLKAARQRITQELSELKNRMDRFDNERIHLNRNLVYLLSRHPQTKVKTSKEEMTRALSELRCEILNLKKRLVNGYETFLRDSYRRYLGVEEAFIGNDPEGVAMRDDLIERFEGVIEPDVKGALEVIIRFVERCHNF